MAIVQIINEGVVVETRREFEGIEIYSHNEGTIDVFYREVCLHDGIEVSRISKSYSSSYVDWLATQYGAETITAIESRLAQPDPTT